MKILAFDQSTVKTGYAVVDGTDLEKHGVIDLHKEDDQWIRSQVMFKEIDKMIRTVKPNLVIIEGVALQTNPQVLIKLGQLQGAIMASAWCKNLPVHIYLPSEWRKQLGIKQGKGVKRQDLKKQVVALIEELYGFKPIEDEAEAIAIALCYLRESGILPDNKENEDYGKEGKESETD